MRLMLRGCRGDPCSCGVWTGRTAAESGQNTAMALGNANTAMSSAARYNGREDAGGMGP